MGKLVVGFRRPSIVVSDANLPIYQSTNLPIYQFQDGLMCSQAKILHNKEEVT